MALKRATIGAIVACLAGFALAGPMPYSSSAGNAKVQHYSNPMGYSEGYSANSYDVPVSNYKAVTTKPYLTTERPYYSLKKDSYSAGQPYYPTSTPQPAVYYTTASKKNQQHYSSSTPGPMYYSTSRPAVYLSSKKDSSYSTQKTDYHKPTTPASVYPTTEVYSADGAYYPSATEASIYYQSSAYSTDSYYSQDKAAVYHGPAIEESYDGYQPTASYSAETHPKTYYIKETAYTAAPASSSEYHAKQPSYAQPSYAEQSYDTSSSEAPAVYYKQHGYYPTTTEAPPVYHQHQQAHSKASPVYATEEKNYRQDKKYDEVASIYKMEYPSDGYLTQSDYKVKHQELYTAEKAKYNSNPRSYDTESPSVYSKDSSKNVQYASSQLVTY